MIIAGAYNASYKILEDNSVDTSKIRLLGYNYNNNRLKNYKYRIPLQIDLKNFLSPSEFFKIDKLRARLIKVPLSEIPKADFNQVVSQNIDSFNNLLQNVDEIKLSISVNNEKFLTHDLQDIDLTNQISNTNINKIGQLTDEEVFGTQTVIVAEESSAANSEIVNISPIVTTTEDGRVISRRFNDLNNDLIDMGIDPASSFFNTYEFLNQKDIRYGIQRKNTQIKEDLSYKEVIKSSLRNQVLTKTQNSQDLSIETIDVNDLIKVYEKKIIKRNYVTTFNLNVDEKYLNTTNNRIYVILEAIDVIGLIRDIYYFTYDHTELINESDINLADLSVYPSKYGINEDCVRLEIKNNSNFDATAKLLFKTNNENSSQILNTFENVTSSDILIPARESRFIETNSREVSPQVSNSYTIRGNYEKTGGSVMYRLVQKIPRLNINLSNIVFSNIQSKTKEINRSANIAGYLSSRGINIQVDQIPSTAMAIEIIKRERIQSSGNTSGSEFKTMPDFMNFPDGTSNPFYQITNNRSMTFLDVNVRPGRFYEYKVRLHNYDGTYEDSIETFGDYFYKNSGIVDLYPKVTVKEISGSKTMQIKVDVDLNENSQLKSIVNSLNAALSDIFLQQNQNLSDFIGNTIKVLAVKYNLKTGISQNLTYFDYQYNDSSYMTSSTFVDVDIDPSGEYAYRFIPYVRNIQDIINDLRVRLKTIPPADLNEMFENSKDLASLFNRNNQNNFTFLYSTSGKYTADYLFDNDTIVDNLTYASDTIDGDFYKKGRSLDEKFIKKNLALEGFSIENARVVQLNRSYTSILINFEVTSLFSASIDYYIVMCEKNNRNFIVGSAHSDSSSNEINFIDNTQEDYSGEIRYYVVPVLQDGTKLPSFFLSSIVVNYYDQFLESMRRNN